MAKSPAPVSRAQTLASYAALAALVLVALGVWLKQADYDPKAWGTPPAPSGAAAGLANLDAPLDLAALKVQGLTPMGPPQNFDPVSLSDKINGKAELYLSAGFQLLATQRLALAEDPNLWLEAYVFDMGEQRGAYSVYSTQRRPQAPDPGLGAQAYLTKNALFLTRGRYYLELVASQPGERLLTALQDWARAWLVLVPAQDQALGEMAFFPPEGLDKAQVSLLASDVFGFDRLDQVWAAPYVLNGEEGMAFVSRRADEGQAADLAKAYAQFLLAHGGKEMHAPAALPGGRLVDILGTYELVFNQGAYLAGVHGAESQDLARNLGLALYERLKEAK